MESETETKSASAGGVNSGKRETVGFHRVAKNLIESIGGKRWGCEKKHSLPEIAVHRGRNYPTTKDLCEAVCVGRIGMNLKSAKVWERNKCWVFYHLCIAGKIWGPPGRQKSWVLAGAMMWFASERGTEVEKGKQKTYLYGVDENENCEKIVGCGC